MVLWESDIIPVITNSDFGFFGNLIPLILIIGISWVLVKKPRDLLFIQFPIALVMKVLFPFFHASFLATSFALFIMSVIGSKGDLLADIKEMPQKIRDEVMLRKDMFKQAERSIEKGMIGEKYQDIKELVTKRYNR